MEKSYTEPNILPDEALLRLARQGDNTATNLLFSRHMLALRRTALRYLGNRADSDDVVQNSLMSAYVHLSQFEGRARFRTWLVSIVINAARADRRRPSHCTLSVEEGMQDLRPNAIKKLAAPGCGPDEIFAVQERKRILAESLGNVSRNLKRALYLYYVKELPIREAACAMGVKPQTFKARLFRGRRKLAKCLGLTLPHAGRRRIEKCVVRDGSAPSSENCHSCVAGNSRSS